ncbi:gamma-glutamylcyclotransferase [Luteolibacter yonseiensis]|uniref:Gamma-glutamylcyclotransferase family protein n=1 Tax=Luteolibacter yonseiensis TaxID=1144680 RepID=A0A934VCN7_9BACT|nr:gamma-glutamylcyclotransferase family protein [Luteolibacter yonseiensis]MBK1817340.1 gamma-glutamylcyclotransferase [Luteolibacter yonseiensis]
MSDPQLVFVYGTLRRGGSNHFRMAGAEFIASGTITGRMYRIDWYPGLVLDGAGDEIQGEVYSVGPEQLAALDVFEGLSAGEIEGSEYRRSRTVVIGRDSRPIDAWVWEWLGITDESQRLRDGDWLKHE